MSACVRAPTVRLRNDDNDIVTKPTTEKEKKTHTYTQKNK